MRQYKDSLARRRRNSAVQVERYWSDPEYRLARINRARVWQGLAPLSSLDDAETHGRRA